MYIRIGGFVIIGFVVVVLPAIAIEQMERHAGDAKPGVVGGLLSAARIRLAGALGVVYVVLTLACALSYWRQA